MKNKKNRFSTVKGDKIEAIFKEKQPKAKVTKGEDLRCAPKK